MNEETKYKFDFEIDKLTNSIENVITGDIFDTELIKINYDVENYVTLDDWLFNWMDQIIKKDRIVYKLVIKGNSDVIQGLISLTDREDHIYVNLIESAKFNKGKSKIYFGVPGNLIAFACQKSFELGYDGYIAFDAKSALIKHYEDTLGATHFKGTRMFIDSDSARSLVNQYFNKEKL